MFQGYWGLTRLPFTDDAARQSLVSSPSHAEALARLDFLLESRSRLGLLLGPAGSGKTLVLAEFARRVQRTGTAIAVASAAAADSSQLLAQLAGGLGSTESTSALNPWSAVAERLEELRLEGIPAVALVDDLDRAASGTATTIERLLALPEALLTVVATARPRTLARLGADLLDQAALRIDLTPWSEEETGSYLESTLAAAGRQQPAFEPAAVRRLSELSGGAPRKVNQLAQLALLAGAGQGLSRVDAETIDGVEEELSAAR